MNFKNTLLSLILLVSPFFSQAMTGPTLGDRPEEIQAEVDKAFDHNNKMDGDWFYNGDTSYYGLLNLDEHKLFDNLASENSEEKDVYILDVGCAKGDWGRSAQHAILRSEACKNSGKRFHIFNVTGGKECQDEVEHQDHVSFYQFSQFKVENIDEEFLKRGFNLKNKVDLIVSRWTLRHLVDPFGTLKKMYGLLTPDQGKLMSNGFLFKFDNADEVQTFPVRNENLLSASNATSLFREYTVGRDAGQFLLMKNDAEELNLPLEYTGKTHSIGHGWQCDSKMVTVFNKGKLFKPSMDPEYINNRSFIYCDKDDQRGKDLYKYLAGHKLFDQ